jgi:glycosyltransferase involved in cell wall biosynthesis
VAARLAAAQVNLGHQVRVVAYDGGDQNVATAEMNATIPYSDKVRFIYLPGGGKLESILAHYARRVMPGLVKDADVLHLHGVWCPILLAAADEARRQGRPYFVQPNGMLDPLALKQKLLKKRIGLMFLFRKMLNRSAGLVLGNNEERRLIAPLKLTAPSVVVPLNGMFPEEISTLPPPDALGRRYPRLAGRRSILFVGRFHHKKGVDHLAEAFALLARRHDDVDLVMVGIDEGAEQDFRSRIARHCLESRVHMLGPLHGTPKWEAFAAASCFALPSHQEGFSIAITEALACGVPVVITRNCHFDEVAEVGAGCVVDLDNAAIASAFEQVLADEQRRKGMAAAARDLVATRFSSHVMGRMVLEAYEEAIV